MLKVQVKLIGFFTQLLSHRKAISLDVQEGTNVIQCIREIADLGEDELRKALLDKRGQLNAEIVVLVNNASIPPSELGRITLNNRDILTLIPVVAGG